MPCRLVAVLFAVALAACQTGSTSSDGSTNQSQNTTVSLGQNGNGQNSNVPSAGNTNTVSNTNNTATNTNQPIGAPGSSAIFDANGVQYLGRVATATSLLTWSGSGVVASFTGTTASLSFAPQSGNTYIGLSVDGGATTRVLINANNNIISTGTLRAGNHNVTAVKLNEASLGTAKFNGISTPKGLTQTPAPSRRIEFIGDSITVGYGVEGVSPCTNNSALENAEKTYAALTAQNLGAQYDLIAWSGKGLLRNAASVGNDVSPTMPVLWTRLAATDATSLYDFPASRIPDAVVINLGTNDFTYIGYDANGTASNVRDPLDPNAYQTAYVDFITTVRQRYPDAVIELCSSPMLSDSYPSAAEAQHTTQLTALKAVAAQLGDAKIHVVDFPTQAVASGQNGCDAHPGPQEHQAMAALLTQQLKTDLGW
jgi:lysophospholipase L1-like esterase